MSQDRVLALEGVHNFRDHGGYAMAGGGRVKRGVLWRSGQHHGATDADLARIAGLGLTAVYDLRSSRERDRHPCRRPAAFSAAIHLSDDPAAMTAPHLAAAQVTRQRTAEQTRASLVNNYHKIAFRPELQALVRLYLTQLVEAPGPSLINCMAGKDRTGIAVAMLHSALGVHRDDIMADYLLTNTAGDVEARIAAGMEAVHAVAGEVDEAVLRVLMGVEPEYLDAAFTAIEERHGSFDTFLERELGVDAAMRERLREALGEE